MKKWISLLTCIACTISSVNADSAPFDDNLAVSQELTDDTPVDAPEDDGRKPVGEAAHDGSRAGGRAGKYVLAGCAIAVAVAALILVSRHGGHHKK